MCQFISFFHHPQTGEILVSDLNSHGNTETNLKLNPAGPYREGHYLPNGNVICRVSVEDDISEETCSKLLKSKFPTFTSFFNWCMDQVCEDGSYSGSLDLSGLTTAEGLKLPETVGGSLDLSGLTSKPTNIDLPENTILSI
jgi:hypothetical protein